MHALELLTQFRALGGIADNVCIRRGAFGQGLFSVDPAHAVRVFTPASLLVLPQQLDVRPDGQVRVRAGSGMGPEVVAFHENYQRSLAWGAGGLEAMRRHQQQLCALPQTLKNFLRILGCPDDLDQLPALPDAFKAYCISRQIRVQGQSRLMPVLELINHAGEGAPYVLTPEGVSLSGTFRGEVMARYRQQLDAFHFFFNYHFAAPGRSALSCEVCIGLPGGRSLRIFRLDGLSGLRKGVRVPQTTLHKEEIHLSFVELVNRDAPDLPRQVFMELLQEQGLSGSSVTELFNGLLAHNRRVLQDFLKACAGTDGPIVQSLRAVAGHQLDNLDLL